MGHGHLLGGLLVLHAWPATGVSADRSVAWRPVWARFHAYAYRGPKRIVDLCFSFCGFAVKRADDERLPNTNNKNLSSKSVALGTTALRVQ